MTEMQHSHEQISARSQMKRYSLVSMLVAAVFLVGYFVSSVQHVFLGLLLGFGASYLNLWTTYRNARHVGKTSSSTFSMLIVGLGYVFRMLLALVAVGLALLYPDTFHLIAVVIGIALMYIVMMVDLVIKANRRKR
ncbi:ATP synthase subunit I [Shouchella sp. 1P09AA]|uniref:ATP synthase subunit I n=1 Tax=unclassified Shouchella TaxID=2893065 RepID=UPI0039A0D681